MPGHGAQISARAPTEGYVQTGAHARAGTRTKFEQGLSVTEENLDKLLLILPEFEHLKTRVATLEEEKESMLESLKFTQKEVKELQTKVKSNAPSSEAANKELAIATTAAETIINSPE